MSNNTLMQQTYQAFLNAGMSPNQARAITAEVGRENDFNPSVLFGQHTDANKSVATPNLGFISWNGARRTALIRDLSRQGLMNSNGSIKQGQQSLDAMARFVVKEIQTNPSYAKTKRQFLDNPNVSYHTAARVLGNNYIRWDMAGNTIKNVGTHHAKRDRYYRQLGGSEAAGSVAQTSQAANQQGLSALSILQQLGQPSVQPVDIAQVDRQLGDAMAVQTAGGQLPKQVAADDYDAAFKIPDLKFDTGIVGAQAVTGTQEWYDSLGMRLQANQYNSEQNAAMERMFGSNTIDSPAYGTLPAGLTNYIDKLVRAA